MHRVLQGSPKAPKSVLSGTISLPAGTNPVPRRTSFPKPSVPTTCCRHFSVMLGCPWPLVRTRWKSGPTRSRPA